MYRSGREQARAQAQRKRKQEREGIRKDRREWVTEGYPPGRQGVGRRRTRLVGSAVPSRRLILRSGNVGLIVVKYLEGTDPGYGDHVHQTMAAWTPRARRGGPLIPRPSCWHPAAKNLAV